MSCTGSGGGGFKLLSTGNTSGSCGGGGGTCGGNSQKHAGYLKKKGFVDVDRWYVTCQGDPVLYCYKDQNQTFKALETVDLTKATVLTDFGINPPALLIEDGDTADKWMLQTKDEGEILP